MRKRYSRSYTVLSFLTMFSYRELPSPVFFLLRSGETALCRAFPAYAKRCRLWYNIK